MEKMLKDIGWKGMDWIDLAQDRSIFRVSMNAVVNLWVPVVKYGAFLD
jgi:hypothetical protein